MAIDIKQLGERVAQESAVLQNIRRSVERVIVGQNALIDRLLTALMTNSHVLLEGVPGLAKTLTVTTLAQSLHATFNRIQFTPDLLPADVIGTLVYNPKTGDFSTRPGPVFANIVLADEINRAPAKVQSALLEAMQEHQVTIGGTTYALPEPFLVLATQNPVEQEGTYPLPEAQVDRFLFKVKIDYPSVQEELQILRLHSSSQHSAPVEPVVSCEDIARIRQLSDEIFIDGKIEEYIVSIVNCTRHPGEYGLSDLGGMIRYGASPRATIGLAMAARAQALLDGRGYTTPQDVKSVAYDVLRHRITLTYEAEAEEMTSEELIRRILETVPVP